MRSNVIGFKDKIALTFEMKDNSCDLKFKAAT